VYDRHSEVPPNQRANRDAKARLDRDAIENAEALEQADDDLPKLVAWLDADQRAAWQSLRRKIRVGDERGMSFCDDTEVSEPVAQVDRQILFCSAYNRE
jgi:hypothetical protein